ncbi:DUF3939 domain-containing protein [Bacillus tuaregi]|uniref:DUF3939 domain-containing protein n=1 Tax=Bacillus tuaregi TaxID=1816695 RepID=UPI0008F94AB3|nr:DUF3939 domain-containing protein [Bacillus tuaregi]
MAFNWFKKKKMQEYYPIKEVSIVEMRAAVREFACNMREGINLSVIINDDNSINIDYIKSYLKCIPTKSFYMSRETYEIFEEEEKEMAIYSDVIQAAVDLYIDSTGELPVIKDNPYQKISYKKLSEWLEDPPDIEFYMTDLENLISHKKPDLSKKKHRRSI